MSYERFKEWASRISEAAGVPVAVSHDPETGQHVARGDGVVIYGNTTSLKVQVRWGSGHVANAPLEGV